MADCDVGRLDFLQGSNTLYEMSTPSSPAFAFDGPAVAERLVSLLNEVAKGAGSKLAFSAEFIAPEPLVDEVKECHSHNCTLMAKIKLSVGSNEKMTSVEIPVPYPYHGVFVMGNGNGRFNRPMEARLMVWNPCLVRRPGLWLLHKYKSDGSTELFAELGLLPGKAVSTNSKKNDNKFMMLVLKRGGEPPALSEDGGDGKVLSAFDKAIRTLKTRKKPMMGWNGCVKALKPLKTALKGRYDVKGGKDDDDLATKRLYTYGVFLAENLAQLVWRRMQADEDGKIDSGKRDELDGIALGAEIRNRMSPRKGYVWLHPFARRNAADSISCLTAFSRYGWGGEVLKTLPAWKRQNHPSFKGIVCPVQTPESEHVGLTLNLAAGVTVDSEGVLKAPEESDGLSYAASLLPFYQHTDAARAMMGAKNYVQALPVEYGETPLVTTGAEPVVREVLDPLIQSGLLPKEKNFFEPGVNLVVAFMPWYGLNYNDAIVANESLDYSFSCCRREQDSEYLEPGEKLEPFQFLSDEKSLFYPSGKSIEENETIACISGKKGRRRVRSGLRGCSCVVKPSEPFPSSSGGGLIEWSVEHRHTLGVGDKLMGRHGNKGVISVMLPSDQMPRLPVDERLGYLSGRPVDLVLNPLGVISRMNIGQLLESHAGLLLNLGIGGLPADIGKPFAEVDVERIRRAFKSVNGHGEPVIDECGRMFLEFTGIDGKTVKTESPVVVGVQYFVRLDHIPSKKAHFRGADNAPQEYDSVTGQATRGRSRNGGQRIGEMEMWALDAYRAGSLMRRALTDAYRHRDAEGEGGQTFRSIRALLFAMGVDLKKADNADDYTLKWADDSVVEARGREIGFIIDTPAIRSALRGTFKCPKCGYCITGIDGSRTGLGASKFSSSVEDLFRDKGVVLSGGDYSSLLKPDKSGVVTIGVEKGSPSLAVLLKKGWRSGSVHADITVGCTQYHAYSRVTFKTFLSLTDLIRLPLTCREHTSALLESASAECRVSVKSFGGLADGNVFRDDAADWGFIRLPHAVTNAGKRGDGRPAFKVVPVLPTRYREGIVVEGGTELPDKLTRLYEELAAAARRGKDFQNAVDKLYTHLEFELGGKCGIIRRDGLGRRVDNSGRFVVVPDPSLKWDECGFPLETLALMFGDRLKNVTLNDLVTEEKLKTCQGEQSWNAINLDTCIPLDEKFTRYLAVHKPLVLVNRPPTLHRYNIKALRPTVMRLPKRSPDVYKAVSGIFQDSMLVMSLNPLVCQSMGCDFDGDEISVHVVGPDEMEDALMLLPTAEGNLLSLASGRPVAEFDQDMVLGTCLISISPDLREKFLASILVEGCARCREVSAGELWDAETCCNLMEHLCTAHPSEVIERAPDWMRMAFDTITRKGVSFGYFDLLACRPDGIQGVIRKMRGEPQERWPDYNARLSASVNDRLRGVMGRRDICEPGFYVAAMALSKARGDKQVRQLVAARGYLDAGDRGFKVSEKAFVFAESLVKGMSRDASFWAAMNGRSTMTDKKLSTGRAGHLTRMMVMACWPWRIAKGDCGSQEKERSPATCRFAEDMRICAGCYGDLPDGKTPEDGFPAGVIAAQSIGERGTQLSMKSFHTGASAVNIAAVQALMNNAELFEPDQGPNAYLERLNGVEVYGSIDKRHLLLLWRVISASAKRTLAGAVTRACEADLFTGLAFGRQWKYITDLLRRQNEEGNDQGHSASSVLAKILIGFPGERTEPDRGREGLGMQAHQWADRDPAERFASVVDESDEAEEPVMAPDDDAKYADEAGDDDCPDFEEDSDVEDNANSYAKLDLPPDKAVISLVISGAGDRLRCRVEMPTRCKTDSKKARLAEAVAELLIVNHPEILKGETSKLPFTTHKDMLEHLNGIGPDKGAYTAKNLSEFLHQAWLFWRKECLPVEALFQEGNVPTSDSLELEVKQSGS